MDRITEAISAISIGIVVAEFLRKTGTVLQAIEIYKECLILLHSQTRALSIVHWQTLRSEPSTRK